MRGCLKIPLTKGKGTMGWSKLFQTSMYNPQTNSFESTQAKVKVDQNGHVSDFMHHVELDANGSRNHGHVWDLNKNVSNNGDPIGGRSEVRPNQPPKPSK
jgi:hypothetical protein